MKEYDVLSKKLTKVVESHGINRRDFLKYCAATAAVLGLSELEFTTRVAQAMGTASKKPPVLWLEGQSCTGCTISLTQSYPPVASIILDTISLRHHGTIMAAAGDLAEKVLHDTVKEGGFVLIVEGSIPTADDRFCVVGGKPFKKTIEEAAAKAAAIIAVGACATYGGIPAATPSKGVGIGKILPGKTIINLPTCPVHHDHLSGTILYFLTTGKAPALDKIGRPVMYFGESIHDNCRRRGQFDAGKFLTDWNDPKQKEWCLIQKGCKGPMTYADCAIRRWNAGINFCIDCGSPCQGCAEPGFYADMTPLYTAESEISKKILAMRESGLIPKKENT
ncbi:MAG: hydrogenase small subunit [Thermodesulfovibrionales bacterium]|nr:hydrogenase small subunit [Nitrospinota bacterium]MCG2708802.1 hydrogenase small subunit [Thermodesulfovibrionales bacterium]MDP3048331.1 hydrogenase small subunit [Thermodesulfovibrionales bacterium]